MELKETVKDNHDSQKPSEERIAFKVIVVGVLDSISTYLFFDS